MKKMFVFVLTAILLLGLCACGQDSTQPTAAPTQPTQPAATPTQPTQQETQPEAPTQPTECSHRYEETVTKEPTCASNGEMTYTCSLCGDSYTDVILTQVAHSYADATCTAPKTCAACGATEGEALGHDYKEGKCTRCAAADESYVGLMDGGWAINALNEDVSQIESIMIRFYEGGSAMLGAGIYDRVAPGEAGEDKIVIDGVEYAYAGFGIGGPVSYELKGDIIVITVDGTLTLKRSSGNTLTVVAIDGYVLVDFLQVGDVLTAK